MIATFWPSVSAHPRTLLRDAAPHRRCVHRVFAGIVAIASVVSTAGAQQVQSARPRVREVPAQYASVQAAIDSAQNGDTVLVAPGRYVENIDFRGRAIVVAGRFVRTHDPRDVARTILDGSRPHNPDSASVVLITSPTDGRAALVGFTITGGHGTKWTDARNGHVYVEGGGILCEFASPLIAYNIITDNVAVSRPGARGAGGGAIRCGDGEPEIAHNVIVRNRGPYGGGLVLYFTAAHVHDNLIAWNDGGDTFGGGAFWIAGQLASTAPNRLDRNVIIGNIAVRDTVTGDRSAVPDESGKGAAMLVYSGGVYRDRVVGRRNVFRDNRSDAGGPMSARASDVSLTENAAFAATDTVWSRVLAVRHRP